MEWVLQHHSDLAPLCKTLFNNDIWYFNASWVLEDYYTDSKYNEAGDEEDCDGDDDEDHGSSLQNSDDTDDDDKDKDDGVEEYSENNSEYSENDGRDENCNGEEEEDEDQTALDKTLTILMIMTMARMTELRTMMNMETLSRALTIVTMVTADDEEYSEWNSDDHYTLEIKYTSDDLTCNDFYFLGFHPYKEVIFLAESYRVVAYHLGHCKAQYLVPDLNDDPADGLVLGVVQEHESLVDVHIPDVNVDVGDEMLQMQDDEQVLPNLNEGNAYQEVTINQQDELHNQG
ncbi:hypothetical protein BAE44_0024484, partial [Dichanthelium oligosanthes]